MSRMTLFLVAILGWIVLVAPLGAEVNFSKSIIDSTFAPGARPRHVTAADLTGDDGPDLVLAVLDLVGGSDGVFLYRSDGNGMFTEFALDTTVQDPIRIAAGDIDGDADNDIVVGTRLEGLLCYRNESTGNFSRVVIDGDMPTIHTPVLVDFDGDSDNDVVLVVTAGLFWEVNDGSGGFVRDTLDVLTGISDAGLSVRDLDGDLDNDIVLYSWPGLGIEYYLVSYRNDGGTGFVKDTLDVVGEPITDVFTDDLDWDGDNDIITTLAESNSVQWYRNDGDSFARETIGDDFTQAPECASVADIDGDGDRDVIVTGGNHAIGSVAYYENDGAETFTQRIIDDSQGNYQLHASLDADADGDVDLFVPNNFPFELVFYRNDGPVGGTGPPCGMPRVLTWAYPNPFSTRTRIQFDSSHAFHPGGDVRIRIFDTDGRLIRVLTGERQTNRRRSVEWDGRDAGGRPASSGIYLARIDGEGSGEGGLLVLQR